MASQNSRKGCMLNETDYFCKRVLFVIKAILYREQRYVGKELSTECFVCVKPLTISFLSITVYARGVLHIHIALI